MGFLKNLINYDSNLIKKQKNKLSRMHKYQWGPKPAVTICTFAMNYVYLHLNHHHDGSR
jgi:hypothetical protein